MDWSKKINSGGRPRKPHILDIVLTILAGDIKILMTIKLIGKRCRKIS